MKKLSALLMMTALMGCVSHQAEVSFSDNSQENEYILKQEYEEVPLQNIVIQPDEEIQRLQKIVPPNIQENSFQKQDINTDILAKKLRKEFRSTGIQVKEISGQIDLIIPNKLAFGNTQTILQQNFSENLKSLGTILQDYEKVMIQIIGYTDNTGAVLANRELSQKKADVIADYLRAQGIKSERIITDGAGADNPVGNNMTAKGRELNRRIEMTLISL